MMTYDAQADYERRMEKWRLMQLEKGKKYLSEEEKQQIKESKEKLKKRTTWRNPNLWHDDNPGGDFDELPQETGRTTHRSNDVKDSSPEQQNEDRGEPVENMKIDEMENESYDSEQSGESDEEKNQSDEEKPHRRQAQFGHRMQIPAAFETVTPNKRIPTIADQALATPYGTGQSAQSNMRLVQTKIQQNLNDAGDDEVQIEL